MERAEAIKKIRQMSLPKETMEILEALAPELKENEDERIRKAMLQHFKNKTKEKWCNIPVKDIISWLEKQKEASKAIEAVERIDKYIDEHLANAHDMKDSDPDKKYYRGWDDALGKMSGILQDVYSDEKQKDHFRDDTKMVEQKPAWSEEDKGILLSIKCVIDSVWHNFDYDCSKEELKEMWNWLDTMWQRVEYPQPKTEWSEEDSKRYISIRTTLETSAVLSKEDYDANVVWLRDLVNAKKYSGPKPSWKPSEEQMKALEKIRNIFHVHHLWDEINPILYDYEELMRDLQKLL